MKPILIVFVPEYIPVMTDVIEKIGKQVSDGLKGEYHVLVVPSKLQEFDFKVVK